MKQGRFYRSQIDHFLQHYLTLATKDEISATHLLSEFKEFVAAHSEQKPDDHLKQLHTYSTVYWTFRETSRKHAEGSSSSDSQ